jgi:hypothetical protein
MNYSVSTDPSRICRSYGTSTLHVTYTRTPDNHKVSADLLHGCLASSADRLSVTDADETGIKVHLPEVPAGMYTLEIRDGERTIRHRLMLQ